MERPKSGIMAAALGFLAAGGMPFSLSPAQEFHRQRGKAPPGKRWLNQSAYVPGGESCNVKPAIMRNPKIAANVQMMHEKWLLAFNERRARKSIPA